MKTDPYAAAKMLEEDVRADYRGSGQSLQLLLNTKNPHTLSVLADLMDLPNGHWTGEGDRVLIYQELKARVAHLSVPMPEYDPAGGPQKRAKQKEAWVRWLQVHGMISSTRPTTARGS